MAQGTPISCSLGALKLVLVLLGIALAGYIGGPSLYWQFMEGLKEAASCSPCECDCPSEAARFSIIPPGLSNLSLQDCGKLNPEMKQEMERNMTDLLSEELRLQQSVAEANQQHAELTLLDAKKLASQYQKEAEKCNAGIETCEGARERAEASLVIERRTSALWEKRARQMGWKD
uniref:DUF1068 domain-containing protein n=1 Tax=Araucaria cunninghamii TaxID=56994 RepID=A0A0D6R5J0_ARACU